MAGQQSPLFLERGSYRRRRMMDAVKLIAILGAGLWMIPLLWPNLQSDVGDPVPLSRALSYIFGVWIFLIGVAVFLSFAVRARVDSQSQVDQAAISENNP